MPCNFDLIRRSVASDAKPVIGLAASAHDHAKWTIDPEFPGEFWLAKVKKDNIWYNMFMRRIPSNPFFPIFLSD